MPAPWVSHQARNFWLAAILIVIGGCDGTAEPRDLSSRKDTPSTVATARTPIGPDATSPAAASETPQDPSPFRFTDIAAAAGIDFKHVSGMTTERHFPSANGSGVAIFDYDNDGWMDLYFASSTYLPIGSSNEGRNRLFRNKGDGTFEDKTDAAGLGFHGFCHGVITGDFDNDGDQDVFLATYHQNTFFVNNGDGTFREAGVAAGVAPPAFRGKLVAGDSAPPVLTIDAVEGLRWRVGDGPASDDLEIPVRKGQRLVFRQADRTARRGIDLLIDPERLAPAGTRPTATAWLREIPGSPARLATSYPALGKDEAPVVLAEYEVLADFNAPVPFQCSEHRPAWSSGGATLDFDNDGDLDMYVTNYGWWTVEQHGSKFCGSADKSVRQYCSPKEVVTVKHMLFRNDGVREGVPHFTDVYDDVFVESASGATGDAAQRIKKEQGRRDGHGFGVVAADIDNDGDVDLYVANDQNPAFTYLNLGNGTFLDATDQTGAAYDERGNTQSGMGADAEDINGDGWPELFRTNFSGEYNTLYMNLAKPDALFYDNTASLKLAADAMRWVGWGCALADFDNDGWPDVFVTNGHVDDNYHLLGNTTTPYEEPALLHRNVPRPGGQETDREFKLATRDAGPYFESSHVGRGAAFGDIDNDGDLDIIINHKDGVPGILRNDTPTSNRWIRFKLAGSKSNRDAVGTRIEVVANGRKIVRQRKSGCSMESVNDGRVLVGVGDCQTLSSVLVTWPSGLKTELKDVPTNQQLELVEPEA